MFRFLECLGLHLTKSLKLEIVMWGWGVMRGECEEASSSVGIGGVSVLVESCSNAFLCRDEADSWIRKPNTSGDFLSKSFHRELDPCDMTPSPCALAWRGLAPPRVEAFRWLVVAGKISTADNLRRRGLMSESISEI